MLECEQLDARILPSVAPIPLGHGLQGPALAYLDQPPIEPQAVTLNLTLNGSEDQAGTTGVWWDFTGKLSYIVGGLPVFPGTVTFQSTDFPVINGRTDDTDTSGNYDLLIQLPHATQGWVYAQGSDPAADTSSTVSDYVHTT